MGPGNSTVVGGCAVLLDIGTNPFGLLIQRVPENHFAIYILLYRMPTSLPLMSLKGGPRFGLGLAFGFAMAKELLFCKTSLQAARLEVISICETSVQIS